MPTTQQSKLMPAPIIESVTALSMASVENMKILSKEIPTFVANRLEKDAATQQILSDCRSPIEIYDCLSNFMQESCQQYLSEMNRLGNMIADNNRKSLETLSEKKPQTTAKKETH